MFIPHVALMLAADGRWYFANEDGDVIAPELGTR
jgi:hypothetical protein